MIMAYADKFLILLFIDYYGLKEDLRKGKVNSEKANLNHITYAQSSQSSVSEYDLTCCHPSLFTV